MLEKLLYSLLVLVLTILSGYCDSQGFVHASNVWSNGRVVWNELMRSALGFMGGILLYWLVIRFLPHVGIARSTEAQTLGWFITAMIGISLSTGEFFQWNLLDRAVSVLVIIGLAWLLFRGH